MKNLTLKITLPLPPSLNSCFRNVAINRRIPTKEALKWKAEAQLVATVQAKKQGWELSKEKTIVEIKIFWKDARKSDCDNRLKIFLDSMNGILWEDDHVCLPRFMDYSTDRENPRMEIVIYKKDEKN